MCYYIYTLIVQDALIRVHFARNLFYSILSYSHTGQAYTEEGSDVIGFFRTFWSILTLILLVLAAVLLFAFWVPRLLGFQLFVVTSGSMEPEYPVGALIYVRPVSPEQVQVGQTITFTMPGSDSIATHQVRRIDAETRQFYTQGINNRDEQGNILPDAAPVPFENLIGTPVLCLPMLGQVNQFCTTPPGMYLLLALLAVVVGVSLLLDKLPPSPTSSTKNGI